ncbi:MAG: glycoside hydrolase family 3 C-terminal domain-containing protein [Clostridia bacterium]|nr:glycoside hydrolase family 3 C-terminal domain-containing protein [Clostridia bacterium]
MFDVKTLTTDEKLRLVMGKDGWHTEDLGGKLPTVTVSDATAGLNRWVKDEKGVAHQQASIAYLSAQMLANTWDPAFAEKQGKCIANDCIEVGVDILLGPGANIKRLPHCGRNFEYFSEDPVVAGAMAGAFIRGVESQKVGSCLKHYCANNIELARLSVSSDMDERTLREIYLKVFEIAVRSDPACIMSAYNAVGGTLMSEHKDIYDTLRDEFGFKGLIMSDWGAVRRSSRAINAGLDLEMPYNDWNLKTARKDYDAGAIDEAALDRSAATVAALAEQCAENKKKQTVTLTREEREAFIVEAAREGVVLLKNKNNALPLDKDVCQITGAPEDLLFMGGGSGFVQSDRPHYRLSKALNDLGVTAWYAWLARNESGHPALNHSPSTLCEKMKTADAVILEVGDTHVVETEARDRHSIRLAPEEEILIQYMSKHLTGKKIIVVVYAGAAIDMTPWIDGVDAVVWAGYCGQGGNRAVAEILTGKVNPSGKLAETFPLQEEDMPAVRAPIDVDHAAYEEGLMVGYRWSETAKADVLFPFGYGLSYTEFDYANLTVTREEGGLTASFDITNVGKVDGKEAAQLYLSFESGEAGRPAIELKGFTKVFVPAGQTVRATITVDAREMRYFSLKEQKFVPIGACTVKIGKNARDLVLEANA